jgi:DNA-binding transcriptional regulator YiaG
MRQRNASQQVRTDLIECPDCGSTNIETRKLKDRFQYGSGSKAVELEALVPFHRCIDCGFEFTGMEAEDARHEAICRHLGVMSPIEVVGVRQRYGMTRAEFAEKSRIGEASLARWETGQLIQNAANDNYLFLLCFAENIERLDARYAFSKFPGEQVPVRVQTPEFRELEPADVSARRDQARNFLDPWYGRTSHQCT